jgi:riboflavin kinase/FMN adenylyltransferase
VTGEDFTFGKGRSGNITVLHDMAERLGMSCDAVGPVCDDDGAISSSRIRKALQTGECEPATRLRTRPNAVEGPVQHGHKNGRKLGFPTANIDMGNYLRPRYGIYAVRGLLPDGRIVDGAANLGVRPTFDPPKELLEPHFFDFKDDLYDQVIEVEFHSFIRPEKKFDSLDELMKQMDLDCDTARTILKSCASGPLSTG